MNQIRICGILSFHKHLSEAPAREDNEQTYKQSMTTDTITPEARSPVGLYQMTNMRHPERQAYLGQAVQVLLNGPANGDKHRVWLAILRKPVPLVMAAQH